MKMATLPIILGSSASSRKGVLIAAGLVFTCLSPDIDEKAVAGRDGSPSGVTLAVAAAKAAALISKANTLYPEGALLITADQVVTGPDNLPLEKPESKDEAIRNIRSFSGLHAKTISAVAVTNTLNGKSVTDVAVATVKLRKFTEDNIQAAVEPAFPVPLTSLVQFVTATDLGDGAGLAYGSHVDHGRALAAGMVDVMTCAGGLCIEHPAFARNIITIEGGIDSMHGLPWSMTKRLMEEALQ